MYPPSSKASREVANVTERKNLHAHTCYQRISDQALANTGKSYLFLCVIQIPKYFDYKRFLHQSVFLSVWWYLADFEPG